ncbi:MAG: DUF6531 domain-containing protein, partial [Spirochaetota bacterium]
MDRSRFGVVAAAWLFLLLMLAGQGAAVWARVCTDECSETPRPENDPEEGGGGGGGDGGGGGGGGGGSDDDTGSGGDSSPPDVPSASEAEALETDYLEALQDYSATDAEYRRLVEYGHPSSTRDPLDATTQGMRIAQRDARLRRESYERRQAEQTQRAREARRESFQQKRFAHGTTAGDPVSVATGMFFTTETDFSFSHGDIEIAARRRYRSGRWISGSFGELWNWPFDTRIIRGKHPQAQDLEAESAELLETVGENLSDALAGLNDAFSVPIRRTQDLSAVEQDLSERLSDWETLLDAASATRDEAQAVAAFAAALDRRYRDWSRPARYPRLADDSNSLLEEVSAWLSEVREVSDTFARADTLLTELQVLEAEISEMHAEAVRAARLSESAETANKYARRGLDPEYVVLGGTDIITVVDELGTPVSYRITTEPAMEDAEKFDDGELNHYPRGANTTPLEAAGTAGEVTIRQDGSYLWRRVDGRRFLYSRWGLLRRITDRNGNSVHLEYDRDYRLRRIRDDAAREVAVQWTEERITSLEDPEGHSITYAYDEVGRLSSVTDAVDDSIEYGYSGTRLTEILKPDGSARRYRYRLHNGRWKTATTTDEEGNEEHFRYYPQRGYTEYENPSGVLTRYYFDDRGRTTRLRYADGSEARFTYDEEDNLLTRTDERGYTWHYEYDERGNRVSETDPLGRRRRWSYNGFSKITEETDYLGRTTRGHYDDFGNVVEVVHPDGLRERT